MKYAIWAVGMAALLASCTSKRYEDCDPSMIFGDWAVTDNTMSFGEYDSLYYVINPIANLSDSIYFNGNYTDSYYRADSTRVTLRYGTSDSIAFFIQRMYAVETNPDRLVMMVSVDDDPLKTECVLHLRKDSDSDHIFRCGPDSLFKEMLRRDTTLYFKATNLNSAAEAQGSQNYEFRIDGRHFSRALALTDSLNRQRRLHPADTASPHKHHAPHFKLPLFK